MQDQDPNLEPNDAMKRDLSQLFRSEVKIPPRIDVAVLSNAQKHLRRHRSMGRIWRYGAIAASLAACALICIPMISHHRSARQLAGDIDANGRVDIVDALALAQRIAAHSTAQDINHDGVIDQRDVDALAMQIVKIGDRP